MRTHPIPVQLRASFEAHLAEERIRSTREGCVLASVLYALFGILDIWAIPTALQEVWLIRTIAVIMLLGYYWSTHFPFFIKRYVPLIVTMYLGLGLGIEAMVFLSGPADLARHLYYTGLILVVMALYTWSFLQIWQSAATGLALVVLYVLIALYIHNMGNTQEWPVLMTNCFFFVSANIVGVYANVIRGRYLRENFLLRQNLVSDLQRTEAEKKESEFWSEHDALTGLPNRKHLMPRFDAVIANAARTGSALALLFVDLDGFKPINDQFGHATGDAVLKAVGKRLASCVREDDLVARLGGDEFVVVLSVDGSHHDAARRVARSIIASIASPIREPNIGRALSSSVGIAFYPNDAADAESLLAAADRQLYEAKRQGRGTISVAPD
ncbi:MAG: GGDEF domain-containing protein [Burkholderiales bacterium]|nr:GGDEF domain-containing protein [Burkholderiales bacterium]